MQQIKSAGFGSNQLSTVQWKSIISSKAASFKRLTLARILRNQPRPSNKTLLIKLIIPQSACQESQYCVFLYHTLRISVGKYFLALNFYIFVSN